MVTDGGELAIEFVVQTIVLFIGLSASIIIFTSVFAHFFKKKIPVRALEKWSWILLGISILSGILAILKISVNADSEKVKSLIYEAWTISFFMLQILLFAIGLLLLVIRAVRK